MKIRYTIVICNISEIFRKRCFRILLDEELAPNPFSNLGRVNYQRSANFKADKHKLSNYI